jgi:hypothetical protein
MTEELLTNELASRVMGWKPTPERFVKSGRTWIPRWRFRPLTELADAFLLLDRAAHAYILSSDRHHTFTAEVELAAGAGKASGYLKARTITLAVARALGLEPNP